MKEKGYVCFCTCGFLRLSVLTFFLRLLTMCMMPLAAGIFDCKMLYSSPGKSWYRKDLAYVWVIKKKSKKKLKKLFPCGESVLTSYSYKSVLMGQQGEGTARVTLEKVNVRDGLGVRQTLPPTWVWVIFWFWLVLLSLNTEKKKKLTWDTLLQNWVWAMLDHSPGSQRGSQVITLTTTWLIGGSAGATALTAAFIDSLSLQGVSRTKAEQPGSLNFKAHVWSFLFVRTHALQPGVWGCPKVNLQTKHPSLGAAAMIQVQGSTAFLCFSFYHVHFELLLPALNFSSLRTQSETKEGECRLPRSKGSWVNKQERNLKEALTHSVRIPLLPIALCTFDVLWPKAQGQGWILREETQGCPPRPPVSVHAGKVQDGERQQWIPESVSQLEKEKEPSIPEHNNENFFAGRTKENKIERGERRN